MDMNVTQANPNKEEECIERVLMRWSELKELMEKQVLPKFKKGRPIFITDTNQFADISRSISSYLCNLQRVDLLEVAKERAAREARQAVVPMPAPMIRRDPFQRFVDDFLKEYVKDNDFVDEALQGPVRSFTFKSSETVKEYRSGQRDVDVPAAIIGLVPDILDAIKEAIQTEGVYQYIETESDDSDYIDSEFTYEDA